MQSSKIIGILIENLRIEHHTESAYVIEQEMTAFRLYLYYSEYRAEGMRKRRITSASWNSGE